MSETIRIQTEEGIITRQVRRVRRTEDGLTVGWVSFQGRDTKVTRERRKRTWQFANVDA